MDKKIIDFTNSYIDKLLSMSDDELLNLPKPEGYEYIDEFFDFIEKGKSYEISQDKIISGGIFSSNSDNIKEINIDDVKEIVSNDVYNNDRNSLNYGHFYSKDNIEKSDYKYTKDFSQINKLEYKTIDITVEAA